MMRFKAFLKEEHLTDQQIIDVVERWKQEQKDLFDTKGIRSTQFGSYKVYNGKVEHLAMELKITNRMVVNGELEIPFRLCHGLEIGASELTSFKNFPEKVIGTLSDRSIYNSPLSVYHHITSLEGFPREIQKGMVDLGHDRFERLSFSHVNKFIDRLNGICNILRSYRGPILGFLLVKDLKSLSFAGGTGDNVDRDIQDTFNKHLRGGKDVLDCKEELMQRGYKDYAKL
jgi:hypothetical protein